METEIEDLKALVLNKVRDGENLLQQVQCHFTAVEGSKKLERRIRSEMKFLQKVKLCQGMSKNISIRFFLLFSTTQLLEAKVGVKKEHMLSSNLGSLAAVVDILHQCESPAAVFKVRYWYIC